MGITKKAMKRKSTLYRKLREEMLVGILHEDAEEGSLGAVNRNREESRLQRDLPVIEDIISVFPVL